VGNADGRRPGEERLHSYLSLTKKQMRLLQQMNSQSNSRQRKGESKQGLRMEDSGSEGGALGMVPGGGIGPEQRCSGVSEATEVDGGLVVEPLLAGLVGLALCWQGGAPQEEDAMKPLPLTTSGKKASPPICIC
jgi:hypothetical protein